MAETMTLRAEPRDRAGKGAARAARRSGRVPGVLYGEGKPATMISLDPRALANANCTGPGFFARLVNVEIDGTTHRTLAARRAARSDHRSAAACRFPARQRRHQDHGGRAGAIHQRGNLARHPPRRHAQHRASRDRSRLPGREHSRPLTISLEGLEIGDSIHIGAVKLPEGTRPTLARNFTVASIAAPTAVRDEQVAAACGGRHCRGSRCCGSGRRRSGGTGAAPGAAPALPRCWRQARSRCAGRGRCQTRRQGLSRSRPARTLPGPSFCPRPHAPHRRARQSGTRYAMTRHNIGFLAVDAIATRYRLRAVSREVPRPDHRRHDRRRAYPAAEARDLYEFERRQRRRGGALLQDRYRPRSPSSMTISISSRASCASKRGGGDGGHNGLRSIDASIGPDYWRVRVGVGHPGMKRAGRGLCAAEFLGRGTAMARADDRGDGRGGARSRRR